MLRLSRVSGHRKVGWHAAAVLENIQVCVERDGEPVVVDKYVFTGLIDTGAGLTAIPRALADSLGLPFVRHVRCAGYEGEECACPAYEVLLLLPGFDRPIEIGLAVATSRSDILVGRDVLESLQAVFAIDYYSRGWWLVVGSKSICQKLGALLEPIQAVNQALPVTSNRRHSLWQRFRAGARAFLRRDG
jgi:predicted aspartyl protease